MSNNSINKFKIFLLVVLTTTLILTFTIISTAGTFLIKNNYGITNTNEKNISNDYYNVDGVKIYNELLESSLIKDAVNTTKKSPECPGPCCPGLDGSNPSHGVGKILSANDFANLVAIKLYCKDVGESPITASQNS